MLYPLEMYRQGPTTSEQKTLIQFMIVILEYKAIQEVPTFKGKHI